jgi:hypothetical protein
LEGEREVGQAERVTAFQHVLLSFVSEAGHFSEQDMVKTPRVERDLKSRRDVSRCVLVLLTVLVIYFCRNKNHTRTYSGQYKMWFCK